MNEGATLAARMRLACDVPAVVDIEKELLIIWHPQSSLINGMRQLCQPELENLVLSQARW